jgi:hypothetical protein
LGITAITNVLGNKHSQSCGIRTKDKEWILILIQMTKIASQYILKYHIHECNIKKPTQYTRWILFSDFKSTHLNQQQTCFIEKGQASVLWNPFQEYFPAQEDFFVTTYWFCAVNMKWKWMEWCPF